MTQIKHFYRNYQEAVHVAANRDEIGMYESKKHPFVFYKGYVFEGGRWLYNSMELAIRMGNDPFLGINFKKYCIAFFDKKNKKTAVRDWHWYTSVLADASPFNTDDNKNPAYKLYEIPIKDIFEEKNKLILAKQRFRNLVRRWVDINRRKYNVIYGNSKIFHNYPFCDNESRNIEYEIEKLDDECKGLAIDKYLFGDAQMSLWCNTKYIKIPQPTVEDIIKGTVFAEEQKKHLDMCEFYTKFCYKEGFSWKDMKKAWGTDRLLEIKETVLKRRDLIEKMKIECVHLTQRNRKEAYDKAVIAYDVKSWRDSSILNSGNSFEYEAWKVNDDGFKECSIRKEYFYPRFKNIELKLGNDRDVITSKGAVVGLSDAIRLFNFLYKEYIAKNVERINFTYDHIYISWYQLRHIAYLDKKSEEGESLGYKDWKVQIGCHAIWMEEVKEFCRYYHLEDKVLFDCKPLNKEK